MDRHALPDQHFTLRLQGYRAFRDDVGLLVRPLTLLYGLNQSGKSTLLRLFGLLADSLQAGAGPLDLQSPVLRGATFKELCWMGREPSFSPWLTLAAPGTPAPTLRIQFRDTGGLEVNRVWLIPGAGGDKFKVDLDGPVTRTGARVTAVFAGTYRGQEWNGPLEFDCLLPGRLPEDAQRIAQAVRTATAPLERLQWLHANRLSGREPARAIRCCRADGSDLASLLRDDTGRAVLEQASRWLARQEGLGNEVTLRMDSSGEPALVHGSAGRERLPLDLAGEGIRSLLPVLICAIWAETGAAAPTMLAIEEPEAQLHPTVQVALFDRLVESVRAGIPVVLETHSVYLLRAMQLAVLEGRLSPNEVGLYWVGQGPDGASTIDQIGIADDATLVDWRPDVFEKEQELAHRILDLRWRREASG